MVMDCLRNAKRSLATVSFIADNGLKAATDNGECPLHLRMERFVNLGNSPQVQSTDGRLFAQRVACNRSRQDLEPRSYFRPHNL